MGVTVHAGAMHKLFPIVPAAVLLAVATLFTSTSYRDVGGPTDLQSTIRATTPDSLTKSLQALERKYHAELGIEAFEIGSRRPVSFKADKRFAFASTNKVFIAAATLQHDSDTDLTTLVNITQKDILSYAPITSHFVGTGMTVGALLDAMIRYSDNTAANILVARLGGPSAVQTYLRSIQDVRTKVDRIEPELNSAIPGDVQDTTTPAQYAKDLSTVIFGPGLSGADQSLLRNLMLDDAVGNTTIRAGVDPSWPIADKTGSGGYGVRNDIAVIYPARRKPIVLVIMSRKMASDAVSDDALISQTAKVVISNLMTRGTNFRK